MSKERIDPDKMANDLAGASAFFKGAARQTTKDTDSPVSPSPAASAPPGTNLIRQPINAESHEQTVRPVRDGRPTRRIMIRHPFELYADQLEGLRDLADRQKRQGETGSMSKMVRDAIDRLLDETDDA